MPLATDQKVGGSSPSERATETPGQNDPHVVTDLSMSSSGRFLAASSARPEERAANLTNRVVTRSLQKCVADASVDLAYLDPSFNSNRNYNVIFDRQQVGDGDATAARAPAQSAQLGLVSLSSLDRCRPSLHIRTRGGRSW